VEPLLSNGCFIVAYLAVVAYQYATISSYIRISQNHEIKVKISLGLINRAPRHDDVWRSGGITPPSLTSAPDGGEIYR
jgi:hypothetical protein